MAYAVSDFGLVARPSRPARVHVPGMRKVPGEVLPVQAKVAASYTAASVAKRRAKQAGYDDVLLLDGNGHVAESGTMSCFFVLDGRLLVPALDEVLDGITRRAVLEIAADEGVATTIGPVPLEVLADAEEAFLTSTSRNIWPVGVLTERELPAPGAVTERLAERLTAVLDGADPLSARWLQPL
jgi:branched-chain amino acid aminotransferase